MPVQIGVSVTRVCGDAIRRNDAEAMLVLYTGDEDFSSALTGYSYRKASTGSSREAFTAG